MVRGETERVAVDEELGDLTALTVTELVWQLETLGVTEVVRVGVLDEDKVCT